MSPQNPPAASVPNKQGPMQRPLVASSVENFFSPNLQSDVLRHSSLLQNQPAQTMFNGRPFHEQIMRLRQAFRNIDNDIATRKANLNLPDKDHVKEGRALASLEGKKDTLLKLVNNAIDINAIAGPGLQLQPQQQPHQDQDLAPAISASCIGAPPTGSLSWLLSILKDQEPGSPIVNAEIISPIHQLLFKSDYVNVAANLTDASDVENLLDFMLHLVRNGCLSTLGAGLEANRRARRFMFKVISKMPIIPKSLFITGVTVKAVDCIASGGFGLVFKGKLREEFVALKLLHKSSHKSIDFCREALTWRSLDHRFVLPLLGVYEDDSSSQLFLVSPYMENGTLAQWRKGSNPSTTEIEDRILEVAQGIQYIHSEGIVHGDIQGNNILLDTDSHVQIADFGLTRHLEATATQSGARHQNFAAPELFGDWDSEDDTSDDGQSKARTQKSDIYAFGCLFYEIHYDTMPFSHLNEVRIMKSVARGERAPRLEEPPLADDAWKLIQDCWMQEKTMRPAMEDIVARMTRQGDQTKASELIDNSSKISSPPELTSLLVQSTHLPESPKKNRRITRAKSHRTRKPYDRPEVVIPEHDLGSDAFNLVSSSPTMVIDHSLSSFNDDSEVLSLASVVEDTPSGRLKRPAKFGYPFTGCNFRSTSMSNLNYHTNSHVGRRPYKCPNGSKGCTYAAISPGTAKRHSKTCQYGTSVST